MRTIVKLAISAVLALALPTVAVAKLDEIKNSTPEQYSTYEQKKSEMEAQVKQKLREKHQAAQTSS